MLGKDKLTGFYTDAFMEEGMDREILRAERYERNLTFLLFDFIIPEKYRTDMYFPIFKRIAKEILTHTRKLDIKIRIANRIFIVLPETDEEGARKAANKISETLSAVEFYHTMFDEYFHIVVKFSIGAFPRDGKTREEIIGKLEEKLKQVVVKE